MEWLTGRGIRVIYRDAACGDDRYGDGKVPMGGFGEENAAVLDVVKSLLDSQGMCLFVGVKDEGV